MQSRTSATVEHARLLECREGAGWKRWGPYLAERQWGTVREDRSADGNAWASFPHDHARSRAYEWGEDGILGISDDQQRLCFAIALWNGRDPIIKERLFGLVNSEGNHGEDVKEFYVYADATPTHSYLRGLYRYPLLPYPYDDLITTNRLRTRLEQEYEIIDTGVFDGDAYVDVVVEYAKASPTQIEITISLTNHAAEAAALHVLPHLWCRNTWWYDARPEKPSLAAVDLSTIEASVDGLGRYRLHSLSHVPDELLFTDNETNTGRLFGTPNAHRWVKDGIDRLVVHGDRDAVNPARTGTKSAMWFTVELEAGATEQIRLSLTDGDPVGAVTQQRRDEADQFYASITPPSVSVDEAKVMRQALAGMVWGKQFYFFDLQRWLDDRGITAPRNRTWIHMLNADIISMPDTWEYPWYAAWDLAFHCVPLAMIDPDFARQQLALLLSERYLHPNGQIPAYEWNFSDVNPPVHCWATLFVANVDLDAGRLDLDFLKDAFHKLLCNFTWWVNRKDPQGNNVFEGGFLGLDNIGVFDRSSALPTGGALEQADGTAWMAFFAQQMLQLSLVLAEHDPVYEDMAIKFLDHVVTIAGAMDRAGDNEDDLWDEDDGFFYDVLRFPDGRSTRIAIRSLVGLLPLCASTVIPADALVRHPRLAAHLNRLSERRRATVASIADPTVPGLEGRRLLSVVDERKLRRILERMLDEERFLSDYGIRSLSRWHLEHPYRFEWGGQTHEVKYLPAESDSGMFGGNSNWRGPIWMPAQLLIIRALLQQHLYYGDAFTIECPTGSGTTMTLFEVAREIADRVVSIFTVGPDGRRPVLGGVERFQSDPRWRDHVLFYEYFHGDDGAGLGASHQTGWTGCVAKAIQLFGRLDGADLAGSGDSTITATYTRQP
jgi:hypothetical protein